MEQTTHQSRRQTQNADARRCFMDGMHAYALARPEQLSTVCRLSASAAVGILLGIFCFYYTDAAPIADVQSAAHDYVTARAFSAYSSLRTYLIFFSAWFFHHALPALLPLFTVITVYPRPLCHILTVLRGVLCGFSVCTLTGTFSVFTVYFTVAQAVLCAECIYLCTKCIRYASRRHRISPQSAKPFSVQRLLSETAPTAAAVLLTLTAQALGQLLISCICTLYAG